MIRHHSGFLFITVSFYLVIIGCNSLHIRISFKTPKKAIAEAPLKKSILKELDWSGKEILFVKIGDDYKSFKTINSKFSLLNEKDRFINYSKLENQYGKILGKFYRNGSEYLLIQMKDGRNIKYARTNWEMAENTPPPYCCFTDEIVKIKKMIGQTIWLNKTKDFLYPSTTTFFTFSNKLFDRFEEVKIIDIYPYYNGGYGIPLWLMIKSKDGRAGYVKYNYKDRSRGFFDNYYYTTDPFPKEWGDETIDIVKSGRISVGMTERQVRISWGNPSYINTTVTRHGKSEQWVYNNFKPDLVYIKNGKVDSIHN